MPRNRLQDRGEFTSFCLRRLGGGVIQINISPEQIEDAVDMALELFWEYHAEGSRQMFRKHQITQLDIDNGHIQLADDVLAIYRVLSDGKTTLTMGGGGWSGGNLHAYSYFSDMVSNIPNGTGIGSYLMNMSYFNKISQVFDVSNLTDYNKYQGNLIIHGSNFEVGDWVVYEAVIINDPNEFPMTWNDWWLRSYTTALMKKQWGMNLGKYRDVTLPTGLSINGEQIRQEGIEEVADLEEKLKRSYQNPVDFQWG